MKRSLFYLAASALVLSACTSEEVLDENSVQSNAISFENVVNKQTRAINSNADLSNFTVFGYYIKTDETNNNESKPINIFNGVTVSRVVGENNKWEYSGTQRYWVPGAKYFFYAYSCENISFGLGKGIGGMNLEGDTPTERILVISDYICHSGSTAEKTHQHDLVYASSDNNKQGIEGLNSGNNPVAFKFQHILSKVNVQFTTDFADGYKIEVSDVKILNIRDKGTYNPSKTPQWGSFVDDNWTYPERTSTDPTAPTYVALPMEKGKNTIVAANKEEDVEMAYTENGFVIPCEYNGADVTLSFHVKVTTTDNEDNSVTVFQENIKGTWKPNWIAGNAYTYKVKISGSNTKLEPIVFETHGDMELGWDPYDATEVKMNFGS